MEQFKKHIPTDKILEITKELSPDDLEIGVDQNLQKMIEGKDDYSPDDIKPGRTPLNSKDLKRS